MTRAVFRTTLMVTLLVCPPAQATVYKCVENGKTVFRDHPCKAGHGGKLNLGATIEDDDPTGTRGNVDGAIELGSASVSIGDALGVFHRADGIISLYFIPGRFTAEEVQHFRDVGDGTVLENRQPLDTRLSSEYPFLNLILKFSQGKPATRDNLESVELKLHGLRQTPGALTVLQTAQQVRPALRQLSVFEDVAQGDIDLEAQQERENEGQVLRWSLSVRAPLYFR
jgi:hypothetical protein